MTFSKNQLRKMHGIPESSTPGEPSVLARRKLHESAARWCDRWLTLIHIYFFIFGFSTILLPTLARPWRLMIESTPLLSEVFHSYSSLSGISIINIGTLIAIFTARNLFRPPSGQPTILTYSMIINMEIYPKTKREEVAYWLDIIFGVASVTLWLFLPFGTIAHLILIRG